MGSWYGSHEKDALLGMEECQSPFGIYEVKIPVNKNLECDGIGDNRKQRTVKILM